MDSVEQLVEVAYSRFERNRSLGLRCGVAYSEIDLSSLRPFDHLARQRVHEFMRTYNADKKDIIVIVKKWVAPGSEHLLTMDTIQMAFAEDAQNQLKSQLVADGMYEELAARVWGVFCLSVSIPPE